jgi:hypothetical protein
MEGIIMPSMHRTPKPNPGNTILILSVIVFIAYLIFAFGGTALKFTMSIAQDTVNSTSNITVSNITNRTNLTANNISNTISDINNNINGSISNITTNITLPEVTIPPLTLTNLSFILPPGRTSNVTFERTIILTPNQSRNIYFSVYETSLFLVILNTEDTLSNQAISIKKYPCIDYACYVYNITSPDNVYKSLTLFYAFPKDLRPGVAFETAYIPTTPISKFQNFIIYRSVFTPLSGIIRIQEKTILEGENYTYHSSSNKSDYLPIYPLLKPILAIYAINLSNITIPKYITDIRNFSQNLSIP